MILINKKSAFIFIILTIMLIFSLGLIGYFSFAKAKNFSPDGVKFVAEELLFISIVSSVILILLYAWIIIRSRNILNELDKVIKVYRNGGFTPAASFKKLGKIGRKIELLYHELDALNEKKSLKISALAELNEFFVNNIKLPLLVADASGVIVQASSELLDKLGLNKGDLLNNLIDNVFPNLSYQSIILELERKKSEVMEKFGSKALAFYPILNKSNQLAYSVCVLEMHPPLSYTRRKDKKEEAAASKLPGLFKRLFPKKS
ncbi:MAG: hypothetical protein AB1798_03685 [Spirochaetota bacterium]